MIIEQVDALKVWLTNKLSPICDAEPSALAKYVCALVKKDKHEQDLRDICVDQLDVFLQQNTKPFVDELFEVLKSKAYIPPVTETKPRPPPVIPPVKPESKSPSHQGGKEKEDGQKKKVSEISSTTDDKESKTTSVAVTSATSTSSSSVLLSSKEPAGDSLPKIVKDPPREVREQRATSRDGREKDRDDEVPRDRRDSWKDDRNKEGIRDARDIIRDREKERVDSKLDTREVRELRDRERDFRDRDRDRDYRRRRTRSRSYSPRRRDFDVDRRGRRFEERPRYSPERRWRRRSYSRSPRRNRSPLDRVGPGRPRSRSPRPRSRSPRDRYRPPLRSRTRSRTRSRSPRPRSWSRPTSGAHLRTRSPSNARLPDSRGSTPLQDNDFISSSTNDLPTVTSIVGYRPLGEDRVDNRLPASYEPPSNLVQGSRTHCQNFEEKGFCMLGDVCPYDHGTDPVVVEDVSIPNAMSASSSAGIPSSSGGFIPPDIRIPPPGHMVPRFNLQRPPIPHVEPYMPEAPGLQKFSFLRGPPPDLRLPPPGMMPNRPPQPDPFFLPRREVIINRPTLHSEEGVDHLDGAGPDKEPSRIVIPAKRLYSAISSDPGAINIGPPPPPRMALSGQPSHMFEAGPPPQLPFPTQIQPPPRRGFDYNRLGVRGKIPIPRPQFRPGNLTLEVRKIPHELNNIAKLNEHFGKFGNLTNIQVKFQGDPGGALITFSNSSEASAAYRSPEPVFNNRFIKLFWHNAEKPINLDGETESPVVVTVGEDGRDVQVQQTTVTGGRVGDGIDHPSLMLPVRPTIPPAHKLQLDNTKPKITTPHSASASSEVSNTNTSSVEKSIVYTSSVGNLKKTVFNPAASAAAAASLTRPKAATPFVSPTAVKTADHVSRMEAISRAEEERKLAAVKQVELEQKRQELLAKQIQQQKILLDTLEKRKATMSEEERKDLWKALRTISDAIDKVKYGTGAKRPQTTTFQAPQADQFKFTSSHEQQQVLPYGRGRGWSGIRPSTWGPRGRGHLPPFLSRTHLDNRPKTVEVKGFDLSELEEIKVHFQKFGEIDKVDLVEEVPSVFLTYATRQSAEVAVSQGGKFRKKTLIVRWNQLTPKISRTESTQSSEIDEDLSITLGSLNEEPLLDPSGDDKSEKGLTSLGTPLELDKDSQVFEEEGTNLEENSAMRTQKPVFERSLSEDLLATDEEHFKASYTDDEDDEDHITVTVPNLTPVATPLYSGETNFSSNSLVGLEGSSSELMDEEQVNFDDTGLDYNEDGPWV